MGHVAFVLLSVQSVKNEIAIYFLGSQSCDATFVLLFILKFVLLRNKYFNGLLYFYISINKKKNVIYIDLTYTTYVPWYPKEVSIADRRNRTTAMPTKRH